MTKRERLEATFAGKPTDRVAVALWRHFPGDDQRPADLAAATLIWQGQYDWDFIKVTPASSFCLVEWGAEDAWLGDNEGSREYTRRVIQQPGDWITLPVLDPRAGFEPKARPEPVEGAPCGLGGQLHCLELIHEAVKEDTPFIQTVFSPLAQARNLAGEEQLLVHMRQAPELLHAGLETITQSTIRFVEACRSTGIAGIYYAVQLASYRSVSEAEYREFGEPYDRRILAAAEGYWFNLVHLHGPDVMFDLIAKYSAQALNWHDRETLPTLGKGQQQFRGAVSGGLEHWDDLLRGDPKRVQARVADAIEQTGGRRLIVSSGCVAPINAPFSNLRAVRTAVERSALRRGV
jgi:uroporphyrinogen decarboxylase